MNVPSSVAKVGTKLNSLQGCNDKMFSVITAAMENQCPFLRKYGTTLTSDTKDKFASKCPFGQIVASNYEDMDTSEQQGPGYQKHSFSSMAAQQQETADVEIPLITNAMFETLKPKPEIQTFHNANAPNHMKSHSNKKAFMNQFDHILDGMVEEGTYRKFNHIDRQKGSFPVADNRLDVAPANMRHSETGDLQKNITVWCANDYLGMGQHPVVTESIKEAVDKYGGGSGGTRNISGTNSLHVLLERELADLHSKESALVFSSCYVANVSSISTFTKMLPGTILFSDEKNHASLIEGAKNSGAEKKIFKHNNVAHLRELLKDADPNRPKMIVFESVYSMDGTISPIKEICDLAEEFDCFTFIDEVHAVGLYGRTGAGVAERENQAHRLDIVSGTLGKAFGIYGGYVSANSTIIDIFRSKAPGFIFTTSLPPSVTAGALASVKYVKQHPELRHSLQAKSSLLKDMLKKENLPVMGTPSHIVPLIVGNAKTCYDMSTHLLNKKQIYVQPINAPTVAKGTERFRLTPTPLHSTQKMEALVENMAELWTQFDPPATQEFVDNLV